MKITFENTLPAQKLIWDGFLEQLGPKGFIPDDLNEGTYFIPAQPRIFVGFSWKGGRSFETLDNIEVSIVTGDEVGHGQVSLKRFCELLGINLDGPKPAKPAPKTDGPQAAVRAPI